VGTLLTKNREDYLEETVQTAQTLTPTKIVSRSGMLLEANDAETTSNPSSTLALPLAAEPDSTLVQSCINTDAQSIVDVDTVTTFPFSTQATYDSDTSSLILEYDTDRYVRDIEGHEKLLVYPFLGADRVELAAKELSLCDFNSFYNIDRLITLQLDASVGRNQIITFFDRDCNSLNECNYVNDNIIDFWMLWMSRNIHSSMTSIFILSTNFYTELLHQGVEAVSNWNFNKNRDLFSTEIILVPINLDQHWSLCAIYYANKIQVLAKSGHVHVNEGPFLMHLDSLTYHSADTISRNIRMWLNYEWKKKISGFKGDILNPYNFKLIRPKGKFFMVTMKSSIVSFFVLIT